MVEVEQDYLKQMQDEYDQLRDQNRDLRNSVSGQMSVFGENAGEDNLIRWQLDMREDLDRIYHLLRGDKIVEDAEGNKMYEEPKDERLKPFNEFGVQLLMNIMSFYLNRNTILSNYKEDVIEWKVHDFGNEISDLIFNRYEEMGMDTPDKIKMYPMIIKELVDTVHSAYLRAYRGGERESLRKVMTVNQTETMGRNQQPTQQYIPNANQRSIIKPWTWNKNR